MEVNLSRGAVAAMSERPAALRLRPVLQVAGAQQLPGLPRSAASTPRCRLMLSDGVHCLQGMLVSGLAHLVADGALRRGTVLQLLEYQCCTVRNRRIFIFIHFEILQTESAMIGSPKLYECGQGVQCSCGSSSPAEKVGSNLTRAGLVQGMYMSGPCLASEAEVARKKVAQINDENLECPGNEELAIVKATLSYINTKNFCNTVCPLVVNGRQCNRKVGSNGHGWWHCDRCNQTFVNCDFKYMVLVQLQDSTGMIYAVVSQEAGKELFGCKAKELYSLKHEKRDHAQFDDIVQRVLFQQYLWKLKAETETFNDEQLAKWTIIKAEKVNPSTESHHLLRAIGMLLPEGSGSTSANQACPLVVNGSQCGREAARNSDGWWHCNSCNQTFVTCDYRYRILAQLQDPTGNIYAFVSQAGGEDIFSLSAKELYSMKYEKRDHAQFDNIVERVQFREYLFTVKLDKAEVVNPSTESHRLLSVINKLLLESSGSASVPRTSTGTRTVFSGLESQVQQRVHISSYAMNTGGARYLVSQSDSNSQ
ncbi:replication protein A 70 kDa DNA-binding subunit C-like isoform X2 [Panicum virgatum]|uniref:replication protein A 70 kDa DNA-binding subunit C-like isoform X2 n=1 Tax=Panicum virgatum TaxID=38727 RepID=UPI0019D50BB9|nr:replication protein A 70 kDa DNA-binding subunit C-like isoform X2 [Panicum virgatum]